MFFLPLQGDAILKKRYESWKKAEPIFYQEVSGEKLAIHMEYVSKHFESEQAAETGKRMPDPVVFYCANFKEGYLHIISQVVLNEEQESILSRFTKVFQQTYTRFLDLQKAEIQAREAQIEAALERVRSRTIGMHKSAELAEVVAQVFKELQTLDFDNNQCVIGIIDKESLETEIWQSFGEQLGLPTSYKLPKLNHPFIEQGYQGYLQGKPYLQRVLSGKSKRSYDELIFEKTTLKKLPEEMKRGIVGIKKIHISDAFMSHGMIEVLSDQELSEEKLNILTRFAGVVDLAYTRFLDIKQSEEHTRELAASLAHLKATQSQLIQAEKMASLGQLTAGIAHEIKNPLNFVNNFAEVSNELLEEMFEELESGNVGEVKEIAKDITQNLEKILHHGQRADSIVKGMLQHSRSSDGNKEPTDINALADEYLRLAYHGLRAKDKSFNANMNTDFDPALQKIVIVPQDIGRVILNLITKTNSVLSGQWFVRLNYDRSILSASAKRAIIRDKCSRRELKSSDEASNYYFR